MTKVIKAVSKQFYYITVLVSFLFLLSLSAIVWLSSAITDRKDEAAQWLSQQVGQPVSIGEAELYLLDFFPKLHLRNVHILDKKRSIAVLSANHIYLDIDLIESLNQKQPILNTMQLNEVSLQVNRNQHGDISVLGLDNLAQQSNNDTASMYSLPMDEIGLQQVAIRYNDEQATTLSGNYKLDTATIKQNGRNVAVRANALLPAHIGKQTLFHGEFVFTDKKLVDLAHWQAQINVNELFINSLSSFIDTERVAIAQGAASFNLMVSGDQTQTVQVGGDIGLANANLSVSTTEKTDAVFIDTLNAAVSATWSEQTTTIKADLTNVSINQQAWRDTGINLTVNDAYQVEIPYIDLAKLAPITEALISDVDVAGMQPKGEITNLNLRYSPEDGVSRIDAELYEVAIARTEHNPGVMGLTAAVMWDKQFGQLRLNSKQIKIDATPDLKQPIHFESLSGDIELRQEQNKWLAVVSDLAINNDDFALNVNGSISHSDEATIPNIDIKIADLNVAKWKNYVPLESLSDDFREWSDTAFRAGTIKSGTIKLAGDLAEFPFINEGQKGEFKMDLVVTEMQLDYGEGWPHLYDVDATIVGDGKILTIDSQKGKVAEFAFNKVRTEIDNYLVDAPMLVTKGRIDGTTQKALNFLKNSPLQDRFGQIATSFRATGNTSIDLDLAVPLNNVNSATASGGISFKASQLISDEVDIQIDDVNGHLLFDGDGVSGEGLSAQFLSQAVNIDVIPKKGSTLIEATGEMPVQKVYKKWPELKTDFISGKALFKTIVAVTEQQRGIFNLDVTVLSKLKGVTVDVPQPFGKTANESGLLDIKISEHKSEVLAYQVNYNDLLNTYLLEQGEQLVGEIRLGSGQAKLAETGLSVKGLLKQIRVADWQTWQQKQPQQDEGGFIDSIDFVSLNIDEINAEGLSFTKAALVAEKAAQEWRVNVHSDQAKGRIKLPLVEQGDLPFVFDFDYLHLRLPKTETKEAAVKDKQKASLWPSIQFSAKDLRVDDMKLGSVQLNSRKVANQWAVDKLTISSNSFNAQGSGFWQQTVQKERTQFELTAQTDDLKALLADLGYQQAIEAGKSTVRLQTNWDGAPTDLALATLKGKLNLNVGAGKLIDVEPGAAGRIFGLMSITAIPRRLTLDFSDLFSKGFSFNSISGDFELANGIATTSNLSMAGEAAKIDVTGPIDMVDKNYDQVVKVTPNVSSTLPLAGAVAGGPVGLGVGTAILLVDKIADNLFGTEIVNLVSYSYKLTGPWDEPELTTIRAVTE